MRGGARRRIALAALPATRAYRSSTMPEPSNLALHERKGRSCAVGNSLLPLPSTSGRYQPELVDKVVIGERVDQRRAAMTKCRRPRLASASPPLRQDRRRQMCVVPVGGMRRFCEPGTYFGQRIMRSAKPASSLSFGQTGAKPHR